jgi:hypothetical protein
MAKTVPIPFNTLRGYFSGKRPTEKNLKLLEHATGLNLSLGGERPRPESLTDKEPGDTRTAYAAQLLSDLQYDLTRCLASLLPAQTALSRRKSETRSSLRRKAHTVRVIMDALERNLQPFTEDPERLPILRETISGSDAGYLAGLLGSLFDDRRFRTWKEMTTYTYGSR